MICVMLDVDVSQLSDEGLRFGKYSFEYTYSLQSSSTLFLLSSSFDASALESFIKSQSKYIADSPLQAESKLSTGQDRVTIQESITEGKTSVKQENVGVNQQNEGVHGHSPAALSAEESVPSRSCCSIL